MPKPGVLPFGVVAGGGGGRLNRFLKLKSFSYLLQIILIYKHFLIIFLTKVFYGHKLTTY
jgi:hypothetical protein